MPRVGANAPSRLRRGQRPWALPAALVLAGSLAACQGSGDVREWSPGDHDKGEAAAQVSGGVEDDGATLVDVTWQQNCVRCHGPDGRGQVPEGRMMRAPDLTRGEMSRRSDEELAATITKGRNKMPAFPSLPPRVVELLVKKIRGLR